MNNKLTGILAFMIGTALGSASTWFISKKKYENIVQEEIDSVKEAFSKKNPSINCTINVTETEKSVREKAEKAKEKPSLMEYAKKVKDSGYTDYQKISEVDGLDSHDDFSEFDNIEEGKPTVISPGDFGEYDDYDRNTLILYADDILCDDDDEIIDNADELIGLESLDHFGEYEEDSVFVRNARLKSDYEIIKDGRKYSDVVGKKPNVVEIE